MMVEPPSPVVDAALPPQPAPIGAVTQAWPVAAVRAASPRFASLDAWRGAACLLVVCYHVAVTTLAKYPSLGWHPLYVVAGLGYLGVPVFFVISGYCIAQSAFAPRSSSRTFRSYVRARVRRIYPPYLLSLLIYVPLSALAARLVAHHVLHGSTLGQVDLAAQRTPFWLSTITLTQEPFGQPLISVVAWTLNYEVAFYVLVAFVLIPSVCTLQTSHRLWMLHAVTFSVMTWLAVVGSRPPFPLDLWPQFGLGVLVFDVVRTPGRRSTQAMLAAIAALSVGYALRGIDAPEWRQPRGGLTFTVGAVVAASLLLAHRFDAGLMKQYVVRLFARVGTFSYSIYLVHFAFVGIESQLARMLGLGQIAQIALFPLFVVTPILPAYGFYLVCEAPFARRSPVPAPEGANP